MSPRSAATVAALGLLLAAAPAARADDEAKLPFNPFEKAEKGDFAVYTVKNTGGSALPAGFKVLDGFAIVRVDKVDADWVYLLVEESSGMKELTWSAPEKRRLPRKGDVTLRAFDDVFQKRSLITDLVDTKLADEKCKACGKDVDAKTLTYRVADAVSATPGFEIVKTHTLSLVESVKATGLASMTTEGTANGQPLVKVVHELVGHGQKGKTLWGKTPDDVERASGARRQKGDPKPKSAAKLPFNPFAKAEEGDYVLLSALGGKQLMALVVKWIDGDEVMVALDATTLAGPFFRVPFSKKGDVALEPYLKVIGASSFKNDTIDDFRASDEKRTVGGRELSGKKLSVVISDNDALAKSRTDLTLGIFPEVKSVGLGVYSSAMTSDVLKMKFEYELVGYGTKDKAIFGKTVSEAVAELRAAQQKK